VSLLDDPGDEAWDRGGRLTGMDRQMGTQLFRTGSGQGWAAQAPDPESAAAPAQGKARESVTDLAPGSAAAV
jgi:hypothetical protein